MGLERLEFGVRVRKFMVMSVKICYRSICNYPFLVGLVCFLIFLYRSYPFLFSLLVTASPVLVCTAVLLGSLLIFGSPNIPEIDDKEEEKVSHEVSSLRTGATEDATVVQRDISDGNFVVEKHVGKRWDIAENADEKVRLVDNEASEVEDVDGSVCYKPLVHDDLDSVDICCENGVIDVVGGISNDSVKEKKSEIQEEVLESKVSLSMGEAAEDQHLLADEVLHGNLEVEDGKSAPDFGDVPRDDELNASLLSSWKNAVDNEEDDDDDGASNSGSDGAESLSPDASMADIIPILDELHPLLGSEAPQPAQFSRDGSDAVSERSHGSNEESVESDESENEREEENGDEENVDEGEGVKRNKEDESKSAVKWTEVDQKNLMDLGISEIERNQRLENLIARRRARKSMKLMAENNLIDLDGSDIPLNIAPVSTARHNPFDLPYDSYNYPGLPPIPGSAPSILQPQRNPFDLPYDSNEEKPDLKGDSFQEEFSGFNQRETVSEREVFFRRHESFNVGPSSLGVPRHELKWKPYFVPERLITEGASPSSFHRQSSEVSESKLSSLPDSESVSSVADDEDNKPYEPDISQETELILNEDHVSGHDEEDSQSSGDVGQAENRDVRHEMVEITLGNVESQLEMESNWAEAGVTTDVELNRSYTELTTHVEQAENRDFYGDVVGITSGDVENQLEMESRLSEARAPTQGEYNAGAIHPRVEQDDENNTCRSSLSSLSETDEKISENKGEGSAVFEPRDCEFDESGISTQPSFEESEVHFASREVDDNHHREPIYDSSPSSGEKLLSFSSVSSDTQAEILETSSPSMLVESTDKVSEVHGETAGQGTPSFRETHAAPAESLNENEPLATNLPKIRENDVTYADLSVSSSTSADNIVSTVPESVSEYVSADSGSSSSDKGLKGCVANKEESFTQTQVDLLSPGVHMTLAAGQGMNKAFDSLPEHPVQPNESSEAKSVDRHAIDKEDTWILQDKIHSSNSSENNLVEESVMPEEEIIQTEHDQVHSSIFNVSSDVHGHHDNSEELSSTALSCQHMHSNDVSSYTPEELDHTAVAQVSQVHPLEANMMEEHKRESDKDMPSRGNPSSQLEEQMLEFDKDADKPPIDEHDKLELTKAALAQEPFIFATEPGDKFSTNFSSMTSEFTSSGENHQHALPTHQEDPKDNIIKKYESECPKEVFQQIGIPEGSHVTYTESAVLPEDIKGSANVVLPILEARSLEDIDLAFKQLHEGVDVEEVILPSMIENQQKHADTNSQLPVVEARSLDDIHNALQQSPESKPAKVLPHSTGLRNGSSVEQHDLISGIEIENGNMVSSFQENNEIGAGEPQNFHEEAKDVKNEANVELPVLEVKSLEDIDLAFKLLHGVIDVEDTNLQLPAVEARSVEDINVAFHQTPGSDLAELPHSTDFRNGPSEVERHDI